MTERERERERELCEGMHCGGAWVSLLYFQLTTKYIQNFF